MSGCEACSHDLHDPETCRHDEEPMMDADTYEQRLRDAVLWDVCARKNDPVVEQHLDAYAAWLRLRAVSDQADGRACHDFWCPFEKAAKKAKQQVDALLEAGE